MKNVINIVGSPVATRVGHLYEFLTGTGNLLSARKAARSAENANDEAKNFRQLTAHLGTAAVILILIVAASTTPAQVPSGGNKQTTCLSQGSATSPGVTGPVGCSLVEPTPSPTPFPSPTPTPGPVATPTPAPTPIHTGSGNIPGSFTNFGPVAVNLADLDIHLGVPIFSKPGRGLPFAYSLEYDSALWTLFGSSSKGQSWYPATELGWVRTGPFGWLEYETGTNLCVPTNSQWTWQSYGNYHDAGGVAHPSQVMTGTCGKAPGTYPILDGSGLSLVVLQNGNVNIQTPSGDLIQPVFVQAENFIDPGVSQGGAITDTNGNQIGLQTTNNQFIDTVGTSYAVGGGNLWTPQSLSYTDSNGTQQKVTIVWASYNLQTNFGCTGVADFASTPVTLPQSATFPDGSTEQFTYEATPGNSSSVTGRLASVTLRTGVTISFAYSGGSNGINCSDGSTAGLTVTTADGSWSFQHAATSGSTATTTTVTDAKGNQTALTFQNGFETQRLIYQGNTSGQLLQTITSCYNGNTTSCPATAVTIPVTELTRSTLLPNGLSKSQDTLYDSNGSPTQVSESLWGSPVGGLGRKTVIAYAGLGNGIVNHPASATVYDGATGNQIAQTTYGYDESGLTPTSGLPQHIAVSGSRGNLTSMHRWLNTTGGTLTGTTGYDDAGQILAQTDPKGNAMSLTYACNDAYAAQLTLPSTNSVAHVVSTNYDCNTGVLLSSVDQNKQTTSYHYDALSRPTTVNYPDGGQTTISYLSPFQTLTQVEMNGSQSTATYELTEGYGRLSRIAIANGETNAYNQQDYTYDADGLLLFGSYPYQGTGWGTAKVTSGAGDTYSYDALGRITRLSHSDGTAIQYVQETRNVQITDESGNNRIIAIDGLGRLANVCELTSTTLPGSGGTPAACGLDLPGTGFLTTYNYDALGNLTSVGQGTLNQRTYTYDSISRLLSANDPESGTLTYAYDANSNLISRVSPAPNQTGTATLTTSYGYDALNRLIQRSYSDGVTTTANFFYDTATGWGNPAVTQSNLIGRLSQEWTASPTGTMVSGAVFGYDPMGRIIVNNQCTILNCGTGNTAVNYTYDLAGNMLNTSAQGITASYSYNAAGRITAITSSLVGANFPANVLSGAHYNAFGERTAASYGNVSSTTGLSESRSYDLRGRIASVWSQVNGGAGLEAFGGITYTPNSLISGVNDSINYGNWTYGYDSFSRLASASYTTGSGSPVNYSYAYDRSGNRWQQNGPNSWSQSFNANNQIVGWSYDAAGNLLNDGAHSYTYDPQGRMLTVDGGSSNNGTSYSYDAEGRRVGRVNSSGTYGFYYDLAGRVAFAITPNAGTRGEVYAGADHVATYSDAQLFFILSDWLGNEHVKSTQTESAEQSFENLPFGDGQGFWGPAVGQAGPTLFTGDEHDSESNLEHTWFRQYSSSQGRWMTPDPLSLGAANLSNPQSLNRYAYVNNNPINATDPSGLLQGTTTVCLLDSHGNSTGKCIGQSADGTLTGFGEGGDPMFFLEDTFLWNNSGLLGLLDGVVGLPDSPTQLLANADITQSLAALAADPFAQLNSPVMTDPLLIGDQQFQTATTAALAMSTDGYDLAKPRGVQSIQPKTYKTSVPLEIYPQFFSIGTPATLTPLPRKTPNLPTATCSTDAVSQILQTAVSFPLSGINQTSGTCQ